MEFADAIAFVRGTDNLNLTFRIETLNAEFVTLLETELSRAGVIMDLGTEQFGYGSKNLADPHPRPAT